MKDMARYAGSHDLCLEWGGGQHIPLDMITWKPRDIVSGNRRAIEEAVTLGTRVVRSCSGGLMRWNPENPSTSTLLEVTAESLRAQAQMFRDHGVVLAIETHFEFTTHEILRLFRMCEVDPGDYRASVWTP